MSNSRLFFLDFHHFLEIHQNREKTILENYHFGDGSIVGTCTHTLPIPNKNEQTFSYYFFYTSAFNIYLFPDVFHEQKQQSL